MMESAVVRVPRRSRQAPPIKRPYRAQLHLRKSVRGLEPRMTAEAPEREVITKEVVENLWQVTVYNNETNTYEEVMTVLMIATSCTQEEAYIETWEIDHLGHCVVHRAEESECRHAAEVISKIGIAVVAEPMA